MVTTQEFIKTIFPDLGGGFIEIRSIHSSTKVVISKFYESHDRLNDDLDNLNTLSQESNVYFGVCVRAIKEGTKKAVKSVWCLWVDVDAKDFLGGKTEALERIKQFPIPPTIIIDSGNGFHLYWLLKEVIQIEGQDDIFKIESYLKGVANAIGGDSQAAELARILRIPGSKNLKDPLAPLPVKIIEYEPSRQYNLHDFNTYIVIPNHATVQSNKSGWIRDALLNLSEGNRNGSFAKIAGRLRVEGWEAPDIIALLEPHAVKCSFPLAELHREIEGICRRYPAKNAFPSSLYNIEDLETESKPFEAVLLAQLLQSESQEVEWVIHQILPKEAAGILAGPAGYGKSWMFLDLAIEVSRGGKWLGNFPTQKGSVLYIDEESSFALLKKRLRKLIGGKGVKENDLDVRFVIGQGLCFSNQDSQVRLRNLLELQRPALIIIDSLIRVHRAEENSATDMARVFSEVKGIVRDFNCSILFADHQKKPGNFGVNLDQLLRGSTEKAAFVDTLLSLKKKNDSIIVEHSKSRFAEAVPSFVVRIEDPTVDTTTILFSGDAEEPKGKVRLEEAREFLDTTLSDEWVPRKTMVEQAKEVEISEKGLDEALKAQEIEGVIERENRKSTEGRGGKAAFYRRKQIPSLLPELEMEKETE